MTRARTGEQAVDAPHVCRRRGCTQLRVKVRAAAALVHTLVLSLRTRLLHAGELLRLDLRQHGPHLRTQRRRIVLAARYYLMRLREPPPCRFDVVVIDAGRSLTSVTLQALDLADRIYAVLQLTLPYVRDGKRLRGRHGLDTEACHVVSA